ncbi:thermonuclease family protein [Halobacterium hubeiense]|uniref:thermonuclease family protein n=1 Tax=Halobacterium hubeiense TaxID=1407499 RepID=UPI003C73100C
MNRRALAALAVAALAVSTGCLGPLADGQQSAESRDATVVGVVDGDTVDVLFDDGTEERVRLLGVDTPEVHVDVSPGEFEGVPDSEAGRSCLRSWGERASEYATERLAGESVTVRFDAESDRRGGYDRLLAYVIVENESFNRALLANGYARLYDSEFTERDDYAAVERRAREDGTGLWACAS